MQRVLNTFQWISGGLKGLQLKEASGGFMAFQRFSIGFKEFQGVSAEFKGSPRGYQGVFRKRFQEVSGFFKAFREVTRAFRLL